MNIPGTYHSEFQKASEGKAFDAAHRKKIRFNIGKYDQAVIAGKKQYVGLEEAKSKAASIKRAVIENLDQYLLEFEKKFTGNGGKIRWAENSHEAVEAIINILKSKGVTSVVKSKSMATEEIHLNEALAANAIEVNETDLGEYIVQQAGEKPYHIVTPAMHKSKEDVAKLFHEKFNLPLESTPQDIAGFVRKTLREKFLNAGAGITGANFLVADIGGIAITENEGNALLTVSCPEVHIAICGIEKIIPSIHDLDLFWCLLATYGTGQKVTVYNSVITGPRKSSEQDGPAEVYLVLLDNGRTNLLARPEQRMALTCIRCGACLNGCPVYKTIGGHAYGAVYSGPIGSVITPHLNGMKEFVHLSYASSLCGKCTEICPVKIDIHKLLLCNRNQSVEAGYRGKMEKFVMWLWKKAMLNRWMINKVPSSIKRALFRMAFRKSWGARREMPEIAGESFADLWKKRNKLR